eukprot:symbB.v1.2.019635.t1/scaffold1616.1/size109294/11
MPRTVSAPRPPGHADGRSRGAGNIRARVRFGSTKSASNGKRRHPRPSRTNMQDTGSDTTCSDAEGCQRSSAAMDSEHSDAEYELFVAEGASMPAIAENDKYVSCRPVPGGICLLLRRAEERQKPSLDVQGTLEELEEAVPEVDEDCLNDEGPWHSTKPVWRWRGEGPRRRRPVPHGSRSRGEFGPTAWPYGPRRLPVERPHSAQCAKDFHPKSPYNHARPTRPASAKAALVTPRPSSARPGPIKPTRPSTRPASAPSARPPSRPSSARPASARPSSARPASARPVSARPQSARPTSATSSGPSARLESELEQGWVHPSAMSEKPHASLMDIGQKRSRPQSAPVFKNSNDASHFEADAMLGGQSILFQQQDFLEKQAGGDDGKLQQCFTTLMHNWVTSYQKSRLRARMACRPLFGEGSDARPLAFPKQFAPVPPPLVKPKKRDLDEEMRQLEKALAGSADGESEDDVRPLESVKTVAAGRRGALQLLKGAQLDLTSTIGKKVGTDTQSERKVGAVPTLPGETPRGATTPGASTIFHQMSVKEASVYGGTEGTSMSGLENLSEPSGDFLSPAFGMMPKKDALQKVFQRVADDGEVHKDALPKSLELLGIRHIKPDWVSAILSNVTRFTTLSFEEFNVFVHAYVERQSREYETAFFELDKDGSGTIEAEELGTLLRNLGITPMEQVIQELTQEFDRDNSGDIGLEEFCGLVVMETEWKAKTGRVSLLTRSAATVRLAYSVSRSVKKLEHELASQPDLDKEIVEKRWNQLHRKNAKLVHQHILKYRGFLTKFGQAASTKAGSLPAPWVEELRDLQDELPISNYQEVVRTIRTGLGRPLEELFRDFGQRPIASASVGQAHVAYLRSSGQKVCVKVQHHGVGSLMKTDLVTIEFIAGQMMKLHKGAPDFRDLIREWRRAAKEEVDFQLEAKNALQASKALRRNSVDVVCPEPLQDLCSQRVLTMVFIEGWKITDLDRMPYGADREGLARNLVHAFALLVFEEGLIHGDPHPGNVFVQQVPGGKNAKEVRPVLLDWGIVKRLTVEERLAAAKWIVSVLSQDRQLHISSLLDLGFEFDADPDLPEFATFIEGSMSQCAFLFRDSIPSSSQINFLQQMQEHQEKAENQEKEGKEGKDQSKLIGKVPGVVLFFLRGLEMLQNICGMLEVGFSTDHFHHRSFMRMNQ